MSGIVVIGGGAAGMMAAVFAARAGENVTLLEKNEKLGKKVYITGKGRCNLTNDCDLDGFLAQVPRNPRFLYSALNFFSPRDIMSLLEENGCPVTVQRGKRVFPSSEKASDVTKVLSSLLRKLDVRVRLNCGVKGLRTESGRVTGAELSDGSFLPADAVILACGGLSYPSTGSTGDGYRFAEALGHTVIPASPVLVGLETKEAWPRSLQGLSLRNVTLTLSSGKKTLYTELGEMLFTHFGVSGPLVLEASCHLPDPAEGAVLSIDLKPGLTREQLDVRIRRDFSEAGKKQLKSVLPGLLPASLAEIFPGLCGVDPSVPCSQVTAVQRETLLSMLKGLTLTVKAPRPVDEAVVTRGGVSVKEIEPGTMRSKLVPNLFFAGEMIDVDAHTGGFNLQIAWSTGALAGASSADHYEF
ncbi:MAG: NAD(P)/FAD-dependent oxidoreductase [Clostridia bacterium]|nr:NAD(P)/FAD-dependent oxidoreductase [Clostridia bacterium]